jgi:hypothetical protein
MWPVLDIGKLMYEHKMTDRLRETIAKIDRVLFDTLFTIEF